MNHYQDGMFCVWVLREGKMYLYIYSEFGPAAVDELHASRTQFDVSPSIEVIR